jgi:predicted DNA-binding transcriptional regulator AlpA
MSKHQVEKLAARMALLATLPDDALLDFREVCTFLNRSKASLYRDIRAGRIAAPVKIGSSSRWQIGHIRSLTRSPAYSLA